MPGILPAPATRVNGCGKGFGYRSAPPRPLASRRSDAPPSLLAALLSPDDAAPLPLAPSALPRPLASRRSDAPPSLLAALLSPYDAAPPPLAPSALPRPLRRRPSPVPR